MNVKRATIWSGVALTLALAPMAASAATNLISNGDFELFSGNPVSGYQVVNPSDNSLADWVVGLTSVDVINGGYGAISGNSIDLHGTPGPGSLSQSFSTVLGQSYSLKFDLSRNGSEAPYARVFLNDALQGTFAGGADGSNPAHYTLAFSGTGSSITLKFASTEGALYSGAVLDNVSVTAVPEAETYSMLIAGLGLVGFMARRRMPRDI